ncbi:hypothetical protein HGRIS_004140 [Hohenbuehelia grisea]|uniref:AAA+ ATPase domain-containing protein n=1 Tax=Hohenbuehelia grisea TaxID=104357 RepID=A0ABR3JJC0_9AGAR
MPDPDPGFFPAFNFPPQQFFNDTNNDHQHHHQPTYIPPVPLQPTNPFAQVSLGEPQAYPPNPQAHAYIQGFPPQPSFEPQNHYTNAYIPQQSPQPLSAAPAYPQSFVTAPPQLQDYPPYALPQLSSQIPHTTSNKLTIKVPPVMTSSTRNRRTNSTANSHQPTRRSSRHEQNSPQSPSGSEYHTSEHSAHDEDADADGDAEGEDEQPQEKPSIEYTQSQRGRRVPKKTYTESASEDGDGDDNAGGASNLFENDEDVDEQPRRPTRTSNRTAAKAKGWAVNDEDDEDEEDQAPRKRTRRATLNNFIASDDDDTKHDQSDGRYSLRDRKPKQLPRPTRSSSRTAPKVDPARHKQKQAADRAARASRRSMKGGDDQADEYVASSGDSASGDGSLADAAHTSSEVEPEADAEADLIPEDDDNGGAGEIQEVEENPDGRPYAFRRRAPVNYQIPPPLEEVARKGTRVNGYGGGYGGNSRAGERRAGGAARKGKRLGWSASGAELGRWMGMPGDDSDSDHVTRTPRKGLVGSMGNMFGAGAAAGPVGSAGVGAVGVLPGDLSAAAAGTPSNLGRVRGDAALADADPLGPNQAVSFDDVGGLDEHIHSLKEMTLLPLLYPEVFQNFGITPPRGVLFHGPPGTGKTLLARALAASCRSNGKGISFYMRKGADCLSKWVGEAERQLRLLFEEARNTQPSIIFFDEIDGLAPVRSSKQDQIHASIVSTLLALMDGMDGRGQVVVIGATNRPDAVDPALRRPGRFDREFYFGLPGLEARERILGIMTKEWKGWPGGPEGKEGEKAPEEQEDVLMDEQEREEKRAAREKKLKESKERLKGLAKLTKGYGGADLRALCTEAALNAVQRRYPQIYKSNDRLLLAPETIEIQLRDFMISIKKLVPSSARSSVSAATPLPAQFVPLLSDTLERVKAVVDRVLPVDKKRSALEEAEFEDIGGEDGALEREMTMQAMEKLRVYRPRVIIHGPLGNGQGYIGAAVLHHLEGFNVQSLELGTLMSDSTRTVEAAIVQLFVEAKRHQPSVIYIPSLIGWCAAISESARSTMRAMLDTLAPTDPILLLAIVDGPFAALPRDVRAWFGVAKDNRVHLSHPTAAMREAFFAGLLTDVRRPPNMFADGVQRRKRVLEELPIAPPLEPRQPTAAELAAQEENDMRIVTLLKYRLGPILTELKKKFKRFTKRATEEYNFDPETGFGQGQGVGVGNGGPAVETITTTTVEVHAGPNGITETVEQERTTQPVVNGHVDEVPEDPFGPQQQLQIQEPPLYDMDLERMHLELYKDRYLTPQDFVDDVGKIVHNAGVRMHEDPERLYKAQAMLTATQVSMQDFDPQFRIECERMAERQRKRREERRKAKASSRAGSQAPNANGNGAAATNGVVTRRSARANGQLPEITITDPVQLERRLKRQRTDEANADSHGSEGELSDGRGGKRSRISEGGDEDQDPMDLLSGTTPRKLTPTVRFAGDPIVLDGSASADGPPIAPQEDAAEAPVPVPAPAPDGEAMAVDTPPVKRGGFDPSLLNPASPDEPQPPPAPSLEGILNPAQPVEPPTSQAPPILPSDPENPFQPQPIEPVASSSTQPAEMDMASPPRTPIRTPTELDEHEAESSRPLPAPVLVERSPTPPLPDFHVDESLVADLAHDLRDRTDRLNVEQLEQLRATCLGAVWRHRTEWDRDGLVRELVGVVSEFVSEVEDEGEPPEAGLGHSWT